MARVAFVVSGKVRGRSWHKRVVVTMSAAAARLIRRTPGRKKVRPA